MTNFFLLNTVTQCHKHFFKHSDLFLVVDSILRKKLKNRLSFKNKFQHRRQIGLEYLFPCFVQTIYFVSSFSLYFHILLSSVTTITTVTTVTSVTFVTTVTTVFTVNSVTYITVNCQLLLSNTWFFLLQKSTNRMLNGPTDQKVELLWSVKNRSM